MVWTYIFLTVAVGLVLAHFHHLWKIYDIWQTRIQSAPVSTMKDLIAYLIMANDSYRLASKNYLELAAGSRDPQLETALKRAHDRSFSDPANVAELQRYFSTHIESIQSEFNFVQHMTRYLPLVGVATALVSLTWLMETVREPEFYSNFTPAMGLAFSGLFYGLMITYLVALPLNTRFEKHLRFETKKGEVILTAMAEMQKRPNPFVLAEKLNAMVLPEDRFAWESYAHQTNGQVNPRSA